MSRTFCTFCRPECGKLHFVHWSGLMPRGILVILDSFGIGGAPDAAAFGDEGANTLGHIADTCAAGQVREARPRPGPLHLPHMAALGLFDAMACASGKPVDHVTGTWAAATETGAGKDTPSGHWEITGHPMVEAPAVFPSKTKSFPDALISEMIRQAALPGVLGNCHITGITAVDQMGSEHMRTGRPIVYTSVDSVLQIAAHEETFGLDRLMDLCRITRGIADGYMIGRVIARPFTGSEAEGFARTGNRRDFTMPPKGVTLLDQLLADGRQVMALGKISDIYAGRGITDTRKAHGNMALFDVLMQSVDDVQDGGLLFANFVDFDTLYGHTRDPLGYAAALEAFDARLPELFARLRPDDLLILSADHGNDPTWRGTDHTRERVPVLIHSQAYGDAALGLCDMADIGATLAEYLGVSGTGYGASFLKDMRVLQ